MFHDLDNTLAPGNKPAAVSTTSQPVATDSSPLDIVLVEDVATDASLTRIALNATHIPYKLRIIQKGNEVLPYLMGCQKLGNNALPDLIMLDLGLPCLDGFEVLSMLTTAPAAIRAVPIVILTGAKYFEQAKKYNLWIPACIKKPCSAQQVRDVLGRIQNERQRASN